MVLTIAGDAVALASELAPLRGVTAEEALQHDIERERHRRKRVRKIVEIGHEIRAHLVDPDSNDDAWLYAKSGLPA